MGQDLSGPLSISRGLRCVVFGFFAIAITSIPTAIPANAEISQGDRAWARRAEALDGSRPMLERVETAIANYRAAVELEPASFEARWKLLRAFHYAIDFSALTNARKDALVEDAVALARSSIARVEAGGGEDPDRARLLFWSAVAWGTRAQRVGLLTIVREGVAGRMHDYAERSLDLDPSVDRGGALRLLSRLHATLPHVPFVSGWVDRDEAIPLAERGLALYPDHPGNALVLALTLLELAPERMGEAQRLLSNTARAEPRPEFLVEDLAIREQARERLEAWGGGSP